MKEKEFYNQKGTYNRVPLSKKIKAENLIPIDIFEKFKSKGSYFLESAEVDMKWGRYSIIGLHSDSSIKVKNGEISFNLKGTEEKISSPDPLKFIENYLEENFYPVTKDLPIFSGGLVGFFGYESIRLIENKLQSTSKNPAQEIEDINLLISDKVMIFDNLEKTLESLQERDLKINRLQDAITKKDSITLAIVSSLKKSVGIDDQDIEVSVEKGVVYISIADKLLFKSGSFVVTEKAKGVLEKVAKVINDKPDFEAMIEGHTDSRSYSNGVLVDNWDLSVKRSTSVIRILQGMGVNPAQLIAAGRSSYVPLTDNDTAMNRSKNRRTRVVVLPKIDQFYEMIENEVKTLSGQ